jgi:hypothetical protein
MSDATLPIGLKQIGTQRSPIFELNGVKFFYQGKTASGDLVWQARLEQLVFCAPAFQEMEYRTGLENLADVVPRDWIERFANRNPS